MAAGTAPAQLRPLSVGELLDAAIKVCVAHAGTLVRAVLVVVLPVQILSAVILASTVDNAALLDPFNTEPVTDVSAAYFAGQVAVSLLGGLSFLLATGACFHAIAEAWLGRTPDWRASLRFAVRRALPLLWITVLYVLGVMVGMILLIVPGIWLFVAWAVAYPVLFVEDTRGAKALNRSMSLVRGRWWATFGVLLLGFLLAGVLQFIFGFVSGIAGAFSDSLGFLVFTTTLATLLSALITTPFQAAIVAIVYFDLRVRKEGFDLELLAERLGGGDASEPQYTEAEPGWKPEPAAPDAAPPAEPGREGDGAPPGWLPPGADPPR